MRVNFPLILLSGCAAAGENPPAPGGAEGGSLPVSILSQEPGMALSTVVALALAIAVYVLSKKYASGMIRWVGYGCALVLALAPAEAVIHWVRGFLPGFLGA